MPEQNTNRLWFVLFTVMIGALLIFGYNDGARATAQNIFDHLNGLLSGDVISADEREDLELVTDEDGNSYVELNEGHFASKNKVSVWLKVVKVMNRDNPDEITGWEIVDAGTSIDNIKSGNGSTSIKNAGIRDIDFNITIEGKPVVSIGNGAFKGAELSGDVNLGDVTSVGADAFAGSNFDGRLTGEKVSSIGSGAFSDSSFSNSNTPNLQIVGSGNDGSINVPEKNIDKNVESEVDEKGSAIYAKIRGSYVEESKRYSDVWVELVKEDNGWLVNEAGNAKAVFSDGTGLSGEISFDILIDGLPIVRVADGVFQNASFTGDFHGNSLTEIGSNSFKNSVFTGSVQLPNVTKLGSNAFAASMFTGFFEANQLSDLGSYVFSNSSFKKGFYADKLRKVYVGTFPKAQFSEQISPVLQVVLQDNGNLKAVPRDYDVNGNIVVAQDGNNAVVNLRPAFMDESYNVQPDIYAAVTYNSDIAGWIITSVGSEVNNKGEVITSLDYNRSIGDISFNQTINDVPIKKINSNVFTRVVFSGDFYGDYLIEVTADQFRSSKFSGDLLLPNAETIGASAFSSSLFTGRLNVPKVKLLAGYTFRSSAFNKDINAPVLYSVSDNVMPLASFISQSTANLARVGKNNGNLKANDRDYDVTGNIESETFDTYTVANIRPAYSDNGTVYPDIWVNLTKTDTGYTINRSGTTREAATSTSDITSSTTVGGTISFDQTIDGLPINQIGNGAFRYARFTGNFYGSNLISIGKYGLYLSEFTGELNAPKLSVLDLYGLYYSKFTGDLVLPEIALLGSNPLYGSNFTGDLYVPKVKTVSSKFTSNTAFTGKLTANVLTSVSANILPSANFSEQYTPNLTQVYSGNGNLKANDRDYDITGNIESEMFGTYIVANIRPAYTDNSAVYSDIWVNLTKTDTGYTINRSGTTREAATSTSDITSSNTVGGTISFDQTIDGLPITQIGNGAFRYAKFTGDFYGSNLISIGDNGLRDAKFTGKFYGSNLISIGFSGLFQSIFTGELNVPKLSMLGSYGLYYSNFTGDLVLPEISLLDTNSLYDSNFTGDLYAPKVKTVSSKFTSNTAFTGKLTANVLTSVSANVLPSANFSEQYTPNLTMLYSGNGNLKVNDRDYDVTGNIESETFGTYTVANIRPAYTENSAVYSDIWVKLTKTDTGYTINRSGTTREAATSTSDITNSNRVGGTISFDQTIDGLPITEISSNAFDHAKFTGKFYGSNLTIIRSSCLSSSEFTGELNAPKLIRLEAYGLQYSKFTGDLVLPEITFLGITSLYYSNFTGDLYIPKVKTVSSKFTSNTAFTGKLTANVLTSVSADVLPSANFSSQYTPKLTTIGTNNGNLKQSD